jgi:hypothetical protein
MVCQLGLLGMMGGCAVPVKSTGTETKLGVPSASSRKVVLMVMGKPEWEADEAYGLLVQEWQTAMNAAATDAKMSYAYFAPGAKPAPEAATLVKVKVNEFKFASATKRWTLEGLGSKAFIDADVSFNDMQSGRELGTRKYSSSAGALQGVFSAMTEGQLQAIATAIVKEVTQR